MAATEHDNPLTVNLAVLDDAFLAFEQFEALEQESQESHDLSGSRVYQAGLQAAQATARDVGTQAVNILVETPGFREVAEADSLRTVEQDEVVTEFKRQWLPEGANDEPRDEAAVEAAHVLLSRLRLAIPIGHTAIGWGLGMTHDVHTHGDLIQFFARRGTEPAAPPAPERAVRPSIPVQLGPDVAVVGEGKDRQAIPYFVGVADPRPLAGREGTPLTIGDLRREVTAQAFHWFNEHPGEDLTDALPTIVRGVLGADFSGILSGMSREIRLWWRDRFVTLDNQPIIEQIGERGKPAFRLNPAVPITLVPFVPDKG